MKSGDKKTRVVRATCPLCGTRFERAGDAAACRSCGAIGGCHFLICPRCGYHIPEEPGLLRWLRKLWRSRRVS